MGLQRIHLVFLVVGYFLAYINIPAPWFVTIVTLLYFASPSSAFLFGSYGTADSHAHGRGLTNTRPASRRYTAYRSGSSNDSSRNGILCFNNVMETVWAGWDAEGIQLRVNQWLNDNKPLKGLMESLIVSKLDMGNDKPPVITMIQCIENTHKSTVIEAHFEYSGDMFLEWMMRPSVLPFDLRCLVHHLFVSGRLRIQIYYTERDDVTDEESMNIINRLTVSKVDVSLSEYPDIDGEVQMFDSLDLKSLSQAIPSLTHTLKKRFKENVMMFVYPNTIPLYASGDAGLDTRKKSATSSKAARQAQMGFDKTDMEDLEDELRNNLLDINQLLKMSKLNTGDKSPEAVKIEVCESVLRFLKAGQEPGRIPVSLMDTVKRGFGILNVLVFGEKPVEGAALVTGNILDLLAKTKKEVDEQILDIILRPENMTFIGDVCRVCSLADDLVRNMFRVEDKQVRSRVNQVLRELSLQDIPFIVMNRQRPTDD